jgi:hypothetical protein
MSVRSQLAIGRKKRQIAAAHLFVAARDYLQGRATEADIDDAILAWRKALAMVLAVALTALSLLAFLPDFASAGQPIGTEGGGNHTCIAGSVLPPNVWSLVAFDNAGQPCLTKPNQDASCDTGGTWDWQVHGTLALSGPVGVRTQVQLWIGNGGGSCYGGTSGPIVCDNPATHFLQENGTYAMQGKSLTVPVPFEFLVYQAAPFFSTPADANYFGFWLFVKPSNWMKCSAASYADLVYIDGNNTQYDPGS